MGTATTTDISSRELTALDGTMLVWRTGTPVPGYGVEPPGVSTVLPDRSSQWAVGQRLRPYEHGPYVQAAVKAGYLDCALGRGHNPHVPCEYRVTLRGLRALASSAVGDGMLGTPHRTTAFAIAEEAMLSLRGCRELSQWGAALAALGEALNCCDKQGTPPRRGENQRTALTGWWSFRRPA